MVQHSSVFAQDGSIGGDSASRLEIPSILATPRTSDWRCEGCVTQKWLEDQVPMGATYLLDQPAEQVAARHKKRVSAALKIFDNAFDDSGKSETRKLGEATKHHPRTVEASLTQQKKIVALPTHNGLEVKDSTTRCSTSDPSTIVSELKDTLKSTQDGQSATDLSRNFRGVSISTLNEMHEGMIKNIMTKFWARSNDWLPKTIGCAGNSTTSQTTSNRYEGHEVSSAWTASSRRARNGGSSFKGGKDAEKPYDRPPKIPGKGRDRTLDFACPFKKRYPRRYNLDEHKSCTIGHWASIALMKQHLSRRHKPLIQCQRCWVCFESQVDLQSHEGLSTPCRIREHNPVPRMTVEIESWLKTEKRPGQSEVDRWNAIYGKLFPNSPIPSPYFDPLIDFHNFEQAEVPRMFEESIRALIAEEMLPVEEIIIERMGELVRSSQEQALSAYRAIYNLETETDPQEDFIPPPQSTSYPHNHNPEPREDSNDDHFLGSNDLLMCGCYGLCTCLRNPYEPAILAQPTPTPDFIPVNTSGSITDGNNATIMAMQEPEFTSPEADGERETFEWSSWMND